MFYFVQERWNDPTLGVIILLGNYFQTFLQIYMGVSMYYYEVKGKNDFCNEMIYLRPKLLLQSFQTIYRNGIYIYTNGKIQPIFHGRIVNTKKRKEGGGCLESLSYRSFTIWVTRQSIFDVCLCNTFFKQQQSKALGSELQPQADYRIWRPLVGLGGVGANVVSFYRGTSLVQYNISAATSLQLHSFQLLILKKIYFKATC